MDELEALFETRDKQYFAETIKIFELIGTTLGCVTTYLSDIDDRIDDGVISWEDVTIVDSMVAVIGQIIYDIGANIIVEGEEVTITKDNAEQYQSIVHMAVPYTLVKANVEKDIMEYLYNVGADITIDDFTPPPAAVQDMEFDLSELTDEQIQSLKFSTDKGGH